MFQKLAIVGMAQALAAHAGTRQGIVAQNVANADTPGYKARDLQSFADAYEGGRAEVVQTASALADPNGNTVSLESEMVKAADIKQQHDMALSVYSAASDILRTSLGRR